MKFITTILLIFLLLSFSFGQAQELKKVKKQPQKTKITKKTTKKAAQVQGTVSLNPALQNRVIKKPIVHRKTLSIIENGVIRDLIEKKNASRFHVVEEGYPAEFDEPRNGNESKLVLKNDDGVYRILYRTNNSKEIAYYVYGNTTKSEFELFKFLIDIDNYETLSDPDERLVSVLYEVGRKVFDDIDLIKIEENSVGCIKATYEGNIYVYTDGITWMDDGEFKSNFSGH